MQPQETENLISQLPAGADVGLTHYASVYLYM